MPVCVFPQSCPHLHRQTGAHATCRVEGQRAGALVALQTHVTTQLVAHQRAVVLEAMRGKPLPSLLFGQPAHDQRLVNLLRRPARERLRRRATGKTFLSGGRGRI